MTRPSQKGFAVLEALLIVVVLLVVGGAGYYVWHVKRNTDKPVDVSKNSQTTGTQSAAQKSYTDSVGNFSFSYPGSWTLSKTSDTTDSTFPISRVTLRSPDGKATVHFQADMGGKGGDCQPAPSDVPFRAGNSCNTIEYLSAEPLAINNVYYGKEHEDSTGNITFTYEPTKVMLVTYHFGGSDGMQSYGIGIQNSNPNQPIVLHQPAMGFVDNLAFITTYNSKGKSGPNVFAYANGDDQSFLSSQNAATIKTIFRSLTINN